MKDIQYNFKEGDLVYCSKIPGIHRVIRVFKNDVNKPPMLVTEHLFDQKYNKIQAKYYDREYNIDAGNCKLIDLNALLTRLIGNCVSTVSIS